ncbi:MAG TPA: hypothetical protein VEI46_02175, partial [Thermodesulfovibrionales bacterium]|nr:hypothetical protein [Thermodesulfovibrionales bacterium]
MDDAKLIGLDLSVASLEALEILIEDTADHEVFREILASNMHRPEILKLLMESPNVPAEIKEAVWKQLSLPSPLPAKPRPGAEGRAHGLLQKIQQLSVGERIALALRGGQEIRSILLKDSNKEVVLTVLKNPKITETEVELVAHSRNIPEEALRAIHKNREWMKNYAINLALVNNPKTPPGIGITLVSGLRLKDIAVLEKNKNVPEAIRAVA